MNPMPDTEPDSTREEEPVIMLQRKLGSQGLQVSAIGLGCMGMSDFYGSSEKKQNFEVLTKAIELGVTFWDTSDIYGPHTNEKLLGEYFSKHAGARGKVQLASKFGVVRNEKGDFLGVNSRPEYVKSACEASLQRLGVEQLDLYYQHRVDPEVPIEETVGALSELIKAGKIKYIGLSEAAPTTIRRAHRVHPVSAVQSEYSLWSRDIEDTVLPCCTELGIGFVPYSPLGRGFLAGAIKSRNDLDASDWRLNSPRFSEENFTLNLKLVDTIQEIAKEKKCTPAQLALAWLLAQSPNIVPIPGTRHVTRLIENAGACDVSLSSNDSEAITEFDLRSVLGERYPEPMKSLLFGETPELKAS